MESGPGSSTSSTDAFSPFPNREIIAAAIQANIESLRVGIRVLIARNGLAEGIAEIVDLSDEILQTTVEAALRGAATYDPTRQAHAWLLGIAIHKIRDLLSERTRERARTIPLEQQARSRHGPDSQHGEDEETDNWLDSILYHSTARDRLVDTDPALEELLSLVDEDDRQILTLAYVDRLEGVDMAAALGIRAGAAYMRLARAREHLRQQYLAADRTGRKDFTR